MPQIVILAGPNGAGKTTASLRLLRDELRMTEFVNADAIAAGLSPFDPAAVAMRAGRLMLERMNELAAARADIAFETTLAARTYVPWLRNRMDDGYAVTLFFFWLPSADFAIRRVATRVRLGGHTIDDPTVRRRYARGLSNFFKLYRPLVSQWWFYNSALVNGPTRVVEGQPGRPTTVYEPAVWRTITGEFDDAEAS